MMSEYFSLKYVSNQVGVSDETIRRWIKSGLFPKPIKIGRRVLFRGDDLRRFETERVLAA